MAKGDRWSDDLDVKVREMRNAETVLGVISERGRRRLPLEDIYRQLFNRDLFLRAYGRIYRNDGAMTSVAIPPLERSPSTGEGSSGSSRETSLNASTASTIRCCCRS